LNKLLGDAKSVEALIAGAETANIEALWAPELEHFRQRRQAFLHYTTCAPH
jgi:hypothetical protein